MSELERIWRRVRDVGFAEAVRKATDRASTAAARASERRAALAGPALVPGDAPELRALQVPRAVRIAANSASLPGATASGIRGPRGIALPRTADQRAACGRYLEHRFDLLGSGWVSWGYPDEVPLSAGLLREADRAGAAEVRALVSEGFEPIDWQRDVVSGHRFSESAWWGDCVTAVPAGADLKVPWELGRCQHLPQLALLAVDTDTDVAMAERCRAEFRDTVLDFVATNPPGFGVQWGCAMDAGIRVANWLLAYDMFASERAESGGAGGERPFDAEFERVFSWAVDIHAAFIAEHLEYRADLVGNHFLADVVGLLWARAHQVEVDGERAEQREFAEREVYAALFAQFNEDGTNFEGSTAYHALSLDLVVGGLALLGGVDAEASARLARASHFLMDTVAPDGGIVQVGDNDSGRLFVLAPEFGAGLVGDTRAVGDVMMAALALAAFDLAAWSAPTQDAPTASAPAPTPAAPAPSALAAPAPAAPAPASPTPTPAAPTTDAAWLVTRFEAGPGPSLLEGLKTASYPDFGLWIWHGPRLYLVVRCGSVGQHGLGGHDHCDQLSAELWLDGAPVVRDPGTGVYGADPALRDRYRSVSAHFAPQVGEREPARLESLFALPGAAAGACADFSAERFAGYLDAYGTRVWRIIEIASDAVIFRDIAENGAELHLQACPQPFSPGYGRFEDER